MADILIRMDMPKSCDVCPFVGTNDDLMSDDYRYLYCGFPHMGQYVTDYEASRHPDCPLGFVTAEATKEKWDRLIGLLDRANKMVESAKPKWISVNERLPEPGERVLYCYRGFVGEGYATRSGEWERAGIWTRYYPSHWMPLPEPPEEKANETPSEPKRGRQRKSEKTNKSQKPFADYSWGDCQGEEPRPPPHSSGM